MYYGIQTVSLECCQTLWGPLSLIKQVMNQAWEYQLPKKETGLCLLQLKYAGLLHKWP